MRFLVTGSPSSIDEMVEDLDIQKVKAQKIKDSSRWKFAVRMAGMSKIGMVSFDIDYERQAPDTLFIFCHGMAGGWINQNMVSDLVMKLANEYPSVTVTLSPV